MGPLIGRQSPRDRIMTRAIRYPVISRWAIRRGRVGPIGHRVTLGVVAVRRIAAVALAVAIVAGIAAGPARAQDYAAIIAAPDRTDADRMTDKRRDPVNLLSFTGPKTGWTVLDMGAGAGYSGELMARSVGPTGKVLAQSDKESEKLTARMASPAMRNVTVVVRPFDDPIPPDVHGIDLITFYFAYHDTTYMEVDRAKMDKAMFDALKPGAFLVIADHSARPEDGATVGKSFHRIAEQTLRTEVEAAGFKFVGAGDFLRHPEDARTGIVFRNPTAVDEFVLKFQKPM
jgi:predicted methyltransferase